MALRLAVTAVAIALLLGGCSAPVAALPDGISVSVRQTRFDGPLRQVQLVVANASGDSFDVVSADLRSTRFESTVSFDRPQTVPDGSFRDLPVKLPEATCAEGSPSDEIVLNFVTADGLAGSAVLPIDDVAILEAISTEDCVIAAVADVVMITPPETAEWMPGAHAPVTLDFAALPTGSAGRVTVLSVGATTLFAHVDERGERIVATPVDLTFDAESPATGIPIRLEPSRCDPHAIAEDKKGTLLPFAIEVGSATGTIEIAVDAAVRASLYDYVADWCAMAPVVP